MGANEPGYAWLTDGMLVPLETPSVRDLIHIQAEPATVFVPRADRSGPGVIAQAMIEAASTICCGLEIFDGQHTDFWFALADVVADSASWRVLW